VSPKDKPLVWLYGEVKTPPFSRAARIEAGFLLRRLVAEDFETVTFGRCNWQALLISSMAFGALHGSRWIAGTLAGLLYGFAAIRKGKLGDAVVAHAVTNAILAAYVLIFNQWQLW